MLRVYTASNNCSSKDAHSTAPSTFCAHNFAFTLNNAVITGIAAAVSVFLLYVIFSIISYGIIIHSIIIMSMIMCLVNNIICTKNNLNTKAKLCKAIA